MIVSMKYLSVICMKEDRDKLLAALQKCGEIMLCETEESTHVESSAGHHMRRMEKLIKDVKPYKGKKPLFAQNPEVDASGTSAVPWLYINVEKKLDNLTVILGSKVELQQVRELSVWAKSTGRVKHVLWSGLNRL